MSTTPITDQPPGLDTGTPSPRPPWWRRKLVVIPASGLALILAASIAATAAGGGNHPAAKLAPPPTSSAPANPAPANPEPAPGLTVESIRSDLATVLGDLKHADAAYQEAWVSGGYGNDLQVLINDTQAASGTDTLNVDAQRFNSDASGYLADNDPYLAPGWRDGYSQVRADINALALACGVPPVRAESGGA
jgi:hypothetical protein